MPLVTIASAIWRISVSLMLQPKVFQVFQPIGGVRATPLSSACAGRGATTASVVTVASVSARTPRTAANHLLRVRMCISLLRDVRGAGTRRHGVSCAAMASLPARRGDVIANIYR